MRESHNAAADQLSLNINSKPRPRSSGNASSSYGYNNNRLSEEERLELLLGCSADTARPAPRRLFEMPVVGESK